MKEVKYVGFYDLPDNAIGRVSSAAGIDKMDYISKALQAAGFNVHLICPSWLNDSVSGRRYKSSQTLSLTQKNKITFGPTFASNFKIFRKLKILLSLSWLFFWLLFYAKRNEKILVYHTQWFSLPIRWAKKIKGFRLILEVEEIYGEVWQISTFLKKWETKLLESADNFIAVSDTLAHKLGQRVSIIIYGAYDVPDIDKLTRDRNSEVIRIVYAGNIDHVRNGAFNSIICAALLPDNYEMHICGYGNEDAVNELIEKIVEVNKSLLRQACFFHGLLPSSEFSDFLFSCDIAINPQLSGANMSTLFPSKIIKYLAHNLRVVSTRIESIEASEVASYIEFSSADTPQAMAEAIMKTDFHSPFKRREFIKELDHKFVNEIGNLFLN